MADQRLRALERRYRETGDPDAEAAWLRCSLQAERISADRVALAAWLGSDAARRCLEREPVDPDLAQTIWIGRLREWGKEPAVRAAIALARAGFAAWLDRVVGLEQYGTRLRRELGPLALEAAEAWILEPSRPRAAFARRAGAGLRRGPRYRPTSRYDARLWCVPALAADATAAKTPGTAAAIATAILRVARGRLTPEEARAAVVADLLPWALGLGDPIRHRVQARKGEEPPTAVLRLTSTSGSAQLVRSRSRRAVRPAAKRLGVRRDLARVVEGDLLGRLSGGG